MSERRLQVVAIAAFVVGAALMVPFEGTATRIAGLLALATFIVAGVFAIARPERLGDPPEDA